jgi:steroid 5-alpha reductase family enzyme
MSGKVERIRLRNLSSVGPTGLSSQGKPTIDGPLEAPLTLDWNPLAGTPFGHMLALCVALIAITWLLSVLTKEYSWVDRIWSVAPVVYVGYVAFFEGFEDMRLNVMAALVAVWGARLTFNFARKGGFAAGGEDYRWTVLMERLGPVGFQALNATFISPVQCLLIWGFTAPIHTAWLYRGAPWTVLDTMATVGFLILWAGETVADEQMWRFQQEKKRLRAEGQTVEPGFYWDGLYRFSRHPNYFCEVGQWWMFGLFAVAASGSLLHWTLLGALGLTVLFDSSVRFSESISASKYPDYATYQQTVPRLWPWFPRKANR